MKYIWNYHRCMRCHDYIVTVRTVEGVFPPYFPCQTANCGGQQASARQKPVVDWPPTIIRVAIAEWYRPGPGLLHDMKRTNPKLWHAITTQDRLVLRKLDEPIVWSPDNDDFPKEARMNLV